jgi:hypothetical protein
MDWNDLKDEAARMLLEKDALHIYAALLIQISAAWLSRRTLGDWLPWFWVLGLELINELMDLGRGGEPRLMPWQVVSAIHDIINTMILPTALLVLCRRLPSIFSATRSGSKIGTEADEIGASAFTHGPGDSAL